MRLMDLRIDLEELVFGKVGTETPCYKMTCTAYEDDFKPEEPTTYFFEIEVKYGVFDFQIDKIWDEDMSMEEELFQELFDSLREKVFSYFCWAVGIENERKRN